jgi:hypothetical protein
MAQGAPLIDVDVPVGRSPVVADSVREYLRGSCSLVLETLGKEETAALIVSGSAALGEVTAVRFNENDFLVLSDIDLAVVMRSDSLRERAKRMRPELRKKMSESPGASVICPPPELGVYSVGDLEIQTRKMGVFEMKTSGKVLWGDEHVLVKVPAFRSDEIPRWEAIVLLFNRSLEMLEAVSWRASKDPRKTLRLLYACAKACLDAGTSLAACHGRYVAGYRNRLGRVYQTVEDHYPNGLGGLPADSFMEGLEFWTGFKVEGDLAGVMDRYQVPEGSDHLNEIAWSAFEETRVPLLSVWTALVGAEGADAQGGVLRACRALLGDEPLRGRLSGWKRVFLGGGEVPLPRVLRLAPAGSPLHLLRLCAMCTLDQYGAAAGCGGAGWSGSSGERPAPGEPPIPGEGPALDQEAAGFLDHYFPAPPRFSSEDRVLEDWRKLIVQVWRRWTERFWS